MMKKTLSFLFFFFVYLRTETEYWFLLLSIRVC